MRTTSFRTQLPLLVGILVGAAMGCGKSSPASAVGDSGQPVDTKGSVDLTAADVRGSDSTPIDASVVDVATGSGDGPRDSAAAGTGGQAGNGNGGAGGSAGRGGAGGTGPAPTDGGIDNRIDPPDGSIVIRDGGTAGTGGSNTGGAGTGGTGTDGVDGGRTTDGGLGGTGGSPGLGGTGGTTCPCQDLATTSLSLGPVSEMYRYVPSSSIPGATRNSILPLSNYTYLNGRVLEATASSLIVKETASVKDTPSGVDITALVRFRGIGALDADPQMDVCYTPSQVTSQPSAEPNAGGKFCATYSLERLAIGLEQRLARLKCGPLTVGSPTKSDVTPFRLFWDPWSLSLTEAPENETSSPLRVVLWTGLNTWPSWYSQDTSARWSSLCASRPT